MGSFLRVFQRVAEGELVPVPVARFNAWTQGKGTLPPSDGEVFTVLVGGSCVDRQPVEVAFLELSRHRVSADGTRSRQAAMDDLAAAVRGRDPGVLAGGNVLDGNPAFARARNKARWGWEPTAADVEAIRAAVNRKAKRPLL